ncbi:sulfotransferase family protein [Vibrio parahaemolyticus]|uniref:sulfotransferase family 2 domain-containing protein n=1 Tax=Vibrio parahaemolyticus TaxID=670 RepID=UPI001EFEDFF4|nr:sulfotransferase family 2 domain-containing protein [Vibrio parahaemolyticus]MCG9635029.1 sulfotransferase family protein [Vibrio parahaemolyticus]
MIISHTHKFIYFRCRKVASTSMEIALSQILESQDIATLMSPRDEKLRISLGGRPQNFVNPTNPKFIDHNDFDNLLFYNHMSYDRLKNVMPSIDIDSYFKFCFERNPWEKVVSLWFHRTARSKISFNNFMETGEFKDAINWPIYTSDNKIKMDSIGRYENLEHDFLSILNTIGLPKLDLPNAKSHFRNKDLEPNTLFTPKYHLMIEEAFKNEISKFNYVCPY